MRKHHLALTLVASLLVPTAHGQDDCSDPDLMVGEGSKFFNAAGMTNSMFSNGTCTMPARDYFILWTATFDGYYRFGLCGTSFPVQFSAYDGTDCSATCITTSPPFDCFQAAPTQIWLGPITAGDQILFQIGGAPGNTGTVATSFSVYGQPLPPPDNNTCETATVIVGEGSHPADTTSATSSRFSGGDSIFCAQAYSYTDCTGFGGPCQDFPGDPVHNDVFFQWTPACTGTYRFRVCGQNGIPDFSIHGGVGCAATCIDASNTGTEPCASFFVQERTLSAAVGESFLVQVGNWSPDNHSMGTLTIDRLPGPCPPPPAIACDPAAPHFLGGSVTLAGSAFTGAGLHVEATGGPPGEFGFFIVAPTANGATSIFNGVLCLDGPVARYDAQVAGNQGLPQLDSIGRFNGSGVLENLAGTSTTGFGFDVPEELPYTPAGQRIQPGETWCIQLWYRDQNPPLPNPGSGANFSDALVTVFP